MCDPISIAEFCDELSEGVWYVTNAVYDFIDRSKATGFPDSIYVMSKVILDHETEAKQLQITLDDAFLDANTFFGALRIHLEVAEKELPTGPVTIEDNDSDDTTEEETDEDPTDADDTDDPIEHETDDPIADESDCPIDVPIVHETDDPIEHETDDPIKHETVDPIEHETADPIEHETADSIEHETADPIEHEANDPIEDETNVPIEDGEEQWLCFDKIVEYYGKVNELHKEVRSAEVALTSYWPRHLDDLIRCQKIQKERCRMHGHVTMVMNYSETQFSQKMSGAEAKEDAKKDVKTEEDAKEDDAGQLDVATCTQDEEKVVGAKVDSSDAVQDLVFLNNPTANNNIRKCYTI